MLVQLHRPNMKPFHYVLGVYVLALLQWEIDATQKIPVLGEEQANPKWETVQIPDTLMNDKKPEDGTWRKYAGGKFTWQVEYDRIKSQEQFFNRKEIYKDREVALYIDKSYWNIEKEKSRHNDMMIKPAAEFARHNVHNGIVLALYDGVIFTNEMDPMTKEIINGHGHYHYFEMENKIQIIDVSDKDELERRHEQYKGAYIHTLYYDDDDVVRVGNDGKFLWEPLRDYMTNQHYVIGPLYTRMVLLKVRTSSVLKGDTEIFHKICEAKGEPKQYPVVYYEADKRLFKITYLSEVDQPPGEVVWNGCPVQKERNESLQKPLD